MRDAEFIRLFAEFGYTAGQIAREYDVHPDTVRNVIRGNSFKPEGHRSRGQCNHRKLNAAQVRYIRELAATGLGEQAIARKINNVIGRSTVRQVMSGKTYREVK